MKVAFISRSTLFSVKGGDTIQVSKTAEHLEKIGVTVDIKLTTDNISYESYDLLHFFNITRPADILSHIERTNKPFVVSTIFVDYTEFEQHHRKGLAGHLFRHMSAGMIEYLKALGRFFKSNEKIKSRNYLWMGHARSIQKVIRKSHCLLPNSESEYGRLLRTYGVEKTYRVIPCGVDDELFSAASPVRRNEKMIICVARIEGRKNQLNLIHALRGTEFELYLIGNPAPHQMSYYKACKKWQTPNIHFIPGLSQEELIPYYSEAKVHVLPSWFETVGLSSLEAGIMGCNLVITEKGDATEYFQEDAYYCDPGSPESIRNAIERASKAEPNYSLQEKIKSKFTWREAAFKTFKAYKEL